VAHTLVHQSTMPVLVLRQEEVPAHEEAARAFWTLVPLDGSELAEAALAPAVALTYALAGTERGGLHLMQVVKDNGSAGEEGYASELNGEARQLARSYLATMAERTRETEPGRTLAVTFSVERAPDVASTLLDAAEQEGPAGCDLIAISTHGRSGLQRLVMGSVTEHLLATTHLPMLIVRPPQQP